MATKSKGKKDHRKKVQARNQRLAEQKRKNEKFQREFIMNLIKQEQEKGLFDNSQSISETPTIDGPILNGLDLSGPILDGPILDGPVIEVTEVEEVIENVEETIVENSESQLEDNSGENKE